MIKAPRARKAAKTTTAARPRARGEAFQKGLTALQQYVAREGRLPGRAAVEQLPDGTEHRTGVWIGNQKARRDRLDTAQLAALADLGVDWAQWEGCRRPEWYCPRAGQGTGPRPCMLQRHGPAAARPGAWDMKDHRTSNLDGGNLLSLCSTPDFNSFRRCSLAVADTRRSTWCVPTGGRPSGGS